MREIMKNCFTCLVKIIHPEDPVNAFIIFFGSYIYKQASLIITKMLHFELCHPLFSVLYNYICLMDI